MILEVVVEVVVIDAIVLDVPLLFEVLDLHVMGLTAV